MATRPVFIARDDGPSPVQEIAVEFEWHPGMAMSQRQKSMRALHEAARSQRVGKRILEVSRMSDDELGRRLSAFNLTCKPEHFDREVSVECCFQASKVFERGGPFRELLEVNPADAKRDPRLRESGRLIRFDLFGEEWPTEPVTAFYDWIYMNALRRKPKLAAAAMQYDAFTDIAFNPKKSFSCQARTVALHVALARRGMIDKALSSRSSFLQIAVDASSAKDEQGGQLDLF